MLGNMATTGDDKESLVYTVRHLRDPKSLAWSDATDFDQVCGAKWKGLKEVKKKEEEGKKENKLGRLRQRQETGLHEKEVAQLVEWYHLCLHYFSSVF